MANRCSDCNKFCSTTIEEPSVDTIEVSTDGSAVTLHVEISLEKSSECCADTVATASVEIEEQLRDEDALLAIHDHMKTELPEDEEHALTIEERGATVDEDGNIAVEWTIECECGNSGTLAEGTVNGKVEEWEDT